ncbi:predicted protein [Nematostella vectensis]|uniref:Uncharacterized protein n=1 Tax=Nematostella vectensis TaxID=45351 RepID=A7T0M4_NEMVE|nr:uncharacterized protein LOC5501284 [Nematostella vectensis]EDO30494.1 predicted protein [Nematostella vectensis]|eukprot:XP_001622594.1 predicted protein [Nematostella vectensis]
MADSEGDGLLTGKSGSSDPLFHDKGQSPKAKLWMYIFISFVVVMMMITIIIALFRGSVVDATYLLLGLSIISMGFVQGILIYWARSGDLPSEKLWFLYFVGICLVLESIFTDVLLYHRPQA